LIVGWFVTILLIVKLNLYLKEILKIAAMFFCESMVHIQATADNSNNHLR